MSKIIFLTLSFILCSPVLMPQIAGGDCPVGAVTEKVSVKQRDAREMAFMAPGAPTTPNNCLLTGTVDVEGPVIINWLKSSRS